MHTLAGSLCLTFGGLLSLVSNMYFFFQEILNTLQSMLEQNSIFRRKKKRGEGVHQLPSYITLRMTACRTVIDIYVHCWSSESCCWSQSF